MHIKLNVRWSLDGRENQSIDDRLFPLLRGIHDAGSLMQAAESIGKSYRFAWGLIKEWEKIFNRQLIITEQGRKQGAKLTLFSQTLIIEDSDVQGKLAPLLDDHARRINTSLMFLDHDTNINQLRFFASHDLVMTHFIEEFNKFSNETITYQVRGSLHNLKMLANNECDIAGFHFPIGFHDPDLIQQYLYYLKLSQANCLVVANREQGLIVQRGNPRNINAVSDLTRRSVRFINRQQESGTRILFDSLLEKEKIKPSMINGYVNEEYTHVAVAAMVASGAVHTGMGLKAAARKFHLDFIPLVNERYCLALAPNLNRKVRKAIKSTFESALFLQRAAKIPGYDMHDSGISMTLKRLFI